MMKYQLVEFLPMKVKEVERLLLEDLKAIKVSPEDERLKYHLNDPFCPDKNIIYGVYIIYKQSLIQLLEGKIQSIENDRFKEMKKKDATISLEDIEYILDIATVIVLASERGNLLTNYIYSGTGEKLDSILNLCIGYSEELENKKYRHSLQRFKNDIKMVERMGLLHRILDGS